MAAKKNARPTTTARAAHDAAQAQRAADPELRDLPDEAFEWLADPRDTGDDELAAVRAALAEPDGARSPRAPAIESSPELAAGDVDAAATEADGEEAAGGSTPTPDQDNVEEIGEALGVVYQPGEPLHTTEKIARRDDERWELNPASSEDFGERQNLQHALPEGRRRQKRIKSLILSLTVLAGIPGGAAASKPVVSPVAITAESFLKDAAMGGMAEVELGRLAEQRAASPEVKKFAALMVADHSRTNQEISALAVKEKVELPAKLDAEHQAVRDRLAALSGGDFDRAYMEQMELDHQKAVQMFEQAAKLTSSPDVAAFATRTLPALETHHRMAEKMESAM